MEEQVVPEVQVLPEKPKRKWLRVLVGILFFTLYSSIVFSLGAIFANKTRVVAPSPSLGPSPPSPEPAATPSAELETSEWKTYKDESVTFKFPSRWIEKPILIRGSGFAQEFKDPEGKFSFTFSSIGNYSQVTGKPYANLDEYINTVYGEKVKRTVTIDGQEGAQLFPRAGSENINSVTFFSEDSKFIYTLDLQTGDTPLDTPIADVEEGRKLFNQILSTFKFLK